jgi:hypothetical protein
MLLYLYETSQIFHSYKKINGIKIKNGFISHVSVYDVPNQNNYYVRGKLPKPSRILSFTAVYGVSIAHLVVIVLRPFFVASYTVSNCRRRPENGVSDRLRSCTIRCNTVTTKRVKYD